MAHRRVGDEGEASGSLAQAMLDAAPDAMVGVSEDGTIVMVNVQTEQVFGYRREELLGASVELLVPDRAKGTHPGHRQNYFRNPSPRPMGVGLELSAKRADGTEFPAEISLSGIRTDGGPIALAAIRDITDRRAAEEESRRARTEADRASQAKSEFLSRVSHELRTPLNSILGFGQLLEMEDLGANQQRAVQRIMQGGRHLLGLIDEILDIEKIASGKMTLSVEPVELSSVVGEALELVEPIAQRSGVRTSVLSDGSGLHVRADRQRLKQVVLNLLSNSVKYNREGGEVRIACEPSGEHRARVSIADTGAGIPEKLMEHLFTPFDRLGAERRGIEGTGLGLALSKSLVEVMGGTIGAASVGGQGSTFWIELPLAEPQELEDAAAEVSEPLTASSEARTVLYIEDNLSNLQLVRGIFAYRPAVRLLSAMQGSLGLDLAREHRPDLILLDLHLPDMSGEELLDRLRRDPETSDLRVAIVSADASRSTLERLRRSGVTAFLTKPLDVPTFLETIDGILA
jgi:PAS domain S-box-containing protein